MKITELINRQVLVAGLGVTGQSVVRFLAREGVNFDIADEQMNASALVSEQACVCHAEFSAELFCGFDVIVLSPGIPRAHPAVVAALAAGVKVIGDIELFADAVQVPVIAVTGSNGKSTVVAWVADALNACGIKAVACGNIGKAALDSLDVPVDVMVLELSSFQLESTCSLRPLAAAVLNVSDDHLDRYDDMEHYAAVKRSVYRHAEHCVANHDDVLTWPEEHQTENCTFFTLDDLASGKHLWVRSLLDGVMLSLPGDHNVANALSVIALAAPLKLPRKQLLSALQQFKGLPHRSEFIGERDGVRWYNDSKGTNVEACKKAVEGMPGPVLLILGGISKGADFSPLRDSIRQHVRLLVLIGQDRQLIAEQLQGLAETVMADTLVQAVDLAGKRAVEGDVVLLSPACSSFDMFRNFEDRGEQFTSAVREVLAA